MILHNRKIVSSSVQISRTLCRKVDYNSQKKRKKVDWWLGIGLLNIVLTLTDQNCLFIININFYCVARDCSLCLLVKHIRNECEAYEVCPKRTQTTKVSQKICNILLHVHLWCRYHVIKAVQTVRGTSCGWCADILGMASPCAIQKLHRWTCNIV